MKKGFVFLLAAVLMAVPGCSEKENQTKNTEEEIVQIPKEKEKEEQKEQKETKKQQEYDVKLSERLSDFQFAIDEKVWTLPLKVQIWEEDGWEYLSEKDDSELETESYVEGEHLTKDKTVLTVDLVNLETEKKRLKECFVGGIILEQKKDDFVYQLPGKIIVGKSVLNEVLEQYGLPTDEYEEKEDIYVTYKFGIYKEAEFVFDIDNEILYKVSLKNYREPEEESEKISEETPLEISQYQVPEKLSENPAEYTVSYDHQLYSIPAPVSQFLKNGWKIQEDGSESYVKSRRHGYVTLEKNGQTLYAVVKNYAEQTVKMENTFLTNLSGDFDVIKVPITIGNEITLGMSEEELKIRLEGSNYETEEGENGIVYFLYSDETKKNFIRIQVDRELCLIRGIEMTNSPENIGGIEDKEETDQEAAVLADEDILSEED